MNYYNEHDPFSAAWLRELIKAGHIALGVVDERSIEDVKPNELAAFTQCHFFAGIGGWSLALRLAGWPDDRPVWTGSCPCQPFSAAGKGAGAADERHLWPAWFHLIEQYRPSVVFGEQVEAAIKHRWLDLVQADLESIGYAVGPVVLPAAGVGAPHIRSRLWFVADSEHTERWSQRLNTENEYDGQDTGRPEAHGIAGTCSEVCDLGLPQHPRLQEQRGQPGILCQASRTDAGQTVERTGTSVGGLGKPDGPGSQPRLRATETVGHGSTVESTGGTKHGAVEHVGELGNAEGIRCEGRKPVSEQAAWRVDAGTGTASGSFWSACDWLPCRDGKARPAKSSIFPLVTGLSERMVRGSNSSVAFDADNTAEARVMRLRGYGNSIVPQVAEQFIRSYLEARNV